MLRNEGERVFAPNTERSNLDARTISLRSREEGGLDKRQEDGTVGTAIPRVNRKNQTYQDETRNRCPRTESP